MPSLEQSHVALLVPHYASIGEGSSLRSVAVARELAKHCRQLTVITPDLSERALKKKEVKPDRDGEIHIKYMRGRENFRASLKARLLHELAMARHCGRLLREIDPDLIVASYPPAFTPVPALLHGWKRRETKVVLELRDLMAGALAASGYARNRLVVRLARMYETLLVKGSDAVAIVSPGMRDSVVRASSRKIVLPAYNGIEDTLLDFSRGITGADDTDLRRFRQAAGLSKDEKYVLYAGALTQSYDLPTLIHGFAKAGLEDTKFVILGDGEKRSSYEKMVRDQGIGNVVFHDFVDRLSALKIIAGAEVALHAFNSSPHWNYVLGNKVFDYIAMGTPVLFAGGGTTAALVNDSGGGKVCQPEDTVMLARLLQELAAVSHDYKQNPVGKAYVEDHWRRSDQTRSFIQQLEKAL